jgi:hypothetical protein
MAAQVQDLQFAGPNEATMGAQICAGPTSSVVIDRQGMYWLAGKVSTLSDSLSGRDPIVGSVEEYWRRIWWSTLVFVPIRARYHVCASCYKTRR